MDPLSITAPLSILVTAASQSAWSLWNTVNRFNDRDKTLRRLQHELEDLTSILKALEEAIVSRMPMTTFLESPINRCNQACREFEQSMEEFSRKSKVDFPDWAKMEFMGGNINDFKDTLAVYRLTISVGLGTIKMQTKRSEQVFGEYTEMINDTVYDLEMHLQRIDEEKRLLTVESKESVSVSNTDVDLKDERAVTEQCIRVCEDASSYIKSLMDPEGSLKQQPRSVPAADFRSPFEARILAQKTLNETQDSLSETIDNLKARLASLTSNEIPPNDKEILHMQEPLEMSKKCLEVCKVASNEAIHRQTYNIGELVVDGDSDQVVIKPLADLFDMRKAWPTNNSAQWISSMMDETVQKVSADRYNSRFGAAVTRDTSNSFKPVKPDTQKLDNSHRAEKAGSPSTLDAVRSPWDVLDEIEPENIPPPTAIADESQHSQERSGSTQSGVTECNTEIDSGYGSLGSQKRSIEHDGDTDSLYSVDSCQTGHRLADIGHRLLRRLRRLVSNRRLPRRPEPP